MSLLSIRSHSGSFWLALLQALEDRTLDSRREMDVPSALDEMRSLKTRHEQVDTEAALAALKRSSQQEQLDLEEQDEAAVSSTDMLHRVLPSSRERCCFTIWLSEGLRRRAGASVAAEEQAAARAELQRALSRTRPLDGEEAWRLILHPHIRHHAAKLRHCAEWEQSVRESHPQGPQLQVALDTFTAEVAVVARALAPLLPALAAGLPPEHMPRRSWF
ncbi:hypothetical protein D9Q98_007351 [Chlorella vulgaris]|uniref:Uncharacterized protein n=1 Tax=Chlorella vulgaris TaxID=3077 RepID=A0A9D4TL35_CHLVU|nr:hypothetical protein D9Q98_007351 [Chlorella vulgaris]